MSNSPLLKVKIPYVDDKTDIKEAFNYMAKTINGTFTQSEAVIAAEAPVDPISLSGKYFSGSFSGTGPGGLFNATHTHDFSAIPSGFIIVDTTCTQMDSGGSLTIIRTSWTTTQISIRISVDTGNFSGYSGTYRILVLR